MQDAATPPGPAPGTSLTPEEAAALVGGRLDPGDGRQPLPGRITGVQALAAAGPEEAAFVAAGRDVRGRDRSAEVRAILQDSRVGLALVPEDFDAGGRPCIRVTNPALAGALLARHFHPAPPPVATGVHPTAWVHPGAVLGRDVAVGPQCSVAAGARLEDGVVLRAGVHVGEEAHIGAGTVLFPGVVVYHGVRIGRGCVVHANAVLGADGFGYVWDGRRHVPVPQVGTVEIGDGVHIGAGTCIDRATFGATTIGDGTVIDNLVQVGHNCRIGRCVVLCGQVGLAGSTEVGDGAILAGGATSAGHLRIGAGAKLGGLAAALSDIPDGAEVLGQPAWDARMEFRAIAALRRLARGGGKRGT